MEEVEERIPLKRVYLKGAALYGLYLGLGLAVVVVLGFFALAYFGQYLPSSQGISLIQYVDLRSLIIFATWLFVGTLIGVFILTVLIVLIYNMVTNAGGEVIMGMVDPHPDHRIYANSLSSPNQTDARPKKYTQELV